MSARPHLSFNSDDNCDIPVALLRSSNGDCEQLFKLERNSAAAALLKRYGGKRRLATPLLSSLLSESIAS